MERCLSLLSGVVYPAESGSSLEHSQERNRDNKTGPPGNHLSETGDRAFPCDGALLRVMLAAE